MYARLTMCLSALLAVGAILAPTAVAAGPPSGPPPPPTAPGGQKVTQVAANLMTPTSFAFGRGMVFEGDGGSEQSSGPPNGGVYLLKGGTGIKLAGSPQFVAGLAWHKGALYVSGGFLTAQGAKF